MLPVLGASAQDAPLAGSEWRPILIDSDELSADTGIFVQFGGDNQLSGHGGCNRFFTSYTTADDTIAIGPIASTQMACPEPLMATEQALFLTLEAARRFMRYRIELILFDQNGVEIARLIQTDAD